MRDTLETLQARITRRARLGVELLAQESGLTVSACVRRIVDEHLRLSAARGGSPTQLLDLVKALHTKIDDITARLDELERRFDGDAYDEDR